MTTRSAKSRGFRLGEYWHWLGRRAREIVAGNDDAAQGGVLGWGHCGDQGSRDLARSRKKRGEGKKRQNNLDRFFGGDKSFSARLRGWPNRLESSSRLVHFPAFANNRELMPLIFASH